jgi:hypothetical protein
MSQTERDLIMKLVYRNGLDTRVAEEALNAGKYDDIVRLLTKAGIDSTFAGQLIESIRSSTAPVIPMIEEVPVVIEPVVVIPMEPEMIIPEVPVVEEVTGTSDEITWEASPEEWGEKAVLLKESFGSWSKVAAELEVSTKTLTSRLEKLGLK